MNLTDRLKADILAWLQGAKAEQVTRRQLAEALDVGADDKRALRAALRDLAAEGKLLPVKKNCWAVPGAGHVVAGTLQCHASGFGFLVPDPGSALREDVFIPAPHLGDAVHGDRVLVEWRESAPREPSGSGRGRGKPSRGPEAGAGRRGRKKAAPETAEPPRRPRRLEGRVTRILERSKAKVIGKVIRFKTLTVIPVDARFQHSVLVDDDGGFLLEDGDVVQVEITVPPSAGHRPRGRVLRLVGKAGDPELPLKIILARHEIRTDFAPEALAEADAFAPDPSGDDLAGREDFRHLDTVTIDGETAFDFDDAVNVTRQPDGNFTLWVHIADVSRYVRPGSALDTEAFLRGTSVYFPDRSVPMLPPALSSGVCSLLPGRDRLAFTAVLDVHGVTGRIRKARFTPSVIRSRARMTYTQVAGVLGGDPELAGRFAGQAEHFRTMAELSRVLNRRRRKLGAVDFDLPESVVRLAESGEVLGIIRTERNDAHRLIEEFMLAANEAVASLFTRKAVPALYRVHDVPDPVKVEEFAEVAARFGHCFEAKDEAYEPKDFQRVADGLGDSAVGKFLSYLMLRSFKLAVYAVNNIGHFGLALKDYTHFTSPIRRYPDLVVHRLLRHVLAGEVLHLPAVGPGDLPEIARRSSEREHEAMDAERAVMAWKKAEFMKERLGEEFDGFVSGLKANGFFVELLEHYVEGFVNLSGVEDDYYLFDEVRHCFVGKTGGKMFRLGDPIRVRVARVDMTRHHVEFAPAAARSSRRGDDNLEKFRRRRIKR